MGEVLSMAMPHSVLACPSSANHLVSYTDRFMYLSYKSFLAGEIFLRGHGWSKLWQILSFDYTNAKYA